MGAGIPDALRLLGVLVAAVASRRPVRPRGDEATRSLPGDELVADAKVRWNHAITIRARPADIWPWLVQIGYQRGGMYSYDWLDRLFGFLDRPSATRILPEFQHLAVGDKIPWGRPLGRREELTVAVLEPERALVTSYQGFGMEWVWQFGLYPLDDQRTRLVTRGIERLPGTPQAWLGMRVGELAAFIMTRRMLLNLKARAEALRASNLAGSAPDGSTGGPGLLDRPPFSCVRHSKSAAAHPLGRLAWAPVSNLFSHGIGREQQRGHQADESDHCQ
jgi:hypothetical protein